METATPRPTFLSLPAEIRLQIVAYALEQRLEPGFNYQPWSYDSDGNRGYKLDYRSLIAQHYRASSNLFVLLVCRQFRQDFTPLAWEKTTFIMTETPEKVISTTSEDTLRLVRKLVVPWTVTRGWTTLPSNTEILKLDHLTVVMNDYSSEHDVAKLLHRITNVKRIQFTWPHMRARFKLSKYKSWVEALWNEDYHQRYHGPGSPKVENTWWEGSLKEDNASLLFVAQAPKPIMDEQDYLRLMKSKVDEVLSIEVKPGTQTYQLRGCLVPPR